MAYQVTQKIPKGWTLTTLGEVAEINSLSIDKNYPSEEIEYVDIASVEERRVMQTQMLNIKDAPSRAKRIVRDNDILISTVRPNLKHFCFIKKASANLIASTGFAVISAKIADPYFLYSLLTTSEYTDYLSKIADSHTSAYPSFNPEVIANSKFIIPSLPEQRAIVAVLSSLDDKIELLRKNNKTLEGIAQILFKRWFVEYEFPNEKGKPYKSSGGKMIDSELGEIPVGWRVGRLGEEFEVKDGTHDSPLQAESGRYLITSRHLNQNGLDFNNAYLISHEDFESINKRSKVDRYDILISMIGSVGMLYFVLEENVDYAIKNIGLFKTSQNKIMADYVYLYLRSAEGLQMIKSSVAGTTQSYVTLGTLRDILISIPQSCILEKLNSVTNHLFLKYHNNNSQNQTLSHLRDSLLSKLMKGELRVRGFDQ